MSDPATIAALPALLQAARRSVEEHAPEDGVAGFWRAALATTLCGVEMMAECLVAAIPEAVLTSRRPQQHQQSFYAPLGDRSPVIEEPLAPRCRGHDPRLPGKRPHP
jgi:hypothetical protein